MNFITDKQTLEDLNLLGKFKSNSVFSLFNRVKTAGGERLLEKMFQSPMCDVAAINGRTAVLRRYQELGLVFPFTREAFSAVENYLGGGGPGSYVAALFGMAHKKLLSGMLRDVRFEELQQGLRATIGLLQQLNTFCAQVKEGSAEVEMLRGILSDKRLQPLMQSKEYGFMAIVQYDRLLRGTMYADMERMMEALYRIDVYIAVSDVARERDFCYPEALDASAETASITSLRHPSITRAVPNTLFLDGDRNLLFLTGANMAGKSTFMKAYGIAVYLAHMGFPVAARQMLFSVREGLYTSINVPDSLQLGYSHFYAEVQRVKTVAEAVSRGQKLVVIFDELFKGTNVKDAYDATLAVAAAFGAYRSCLFIISTHIIEVGEALRKTGAAVHFAYLPTVMEGTIPRYTYTLTDGITADRQGMLIIENEGVLDILNELPINTTLTSN